MSEQIITQDAVETNPLNIEESSTVERCLTFESGDLVLYISTKHVIEIINNHTITTLPLMPPYIKGVINLRGQILPVVDNFERGLAAAQEGDAFAEGMQMVYKQLMAALSEMGVQPIEAVGQAFDPNLHNAVMHVEDPEAGENTIVEELQKGYLYKDFVVRHSMVKVAN